MGTEDLWVQKSEEIKRNRYLKEGKCNVKLRNGHAKKWSSFASPFSGLISCPGGRWGGHSGREKGQLSQAVKDPSFLTSQLHWRPMRCHARDF